MRGFFLLVLVVGALWAVDEYAFDGRYSQAAWLEAQSQGQQLRYNVRNWLNKAMAGH
jgi:hypothetical protein